MAPRDDLISDLHTLMGQIIGGIEFAEERLDESWPGWRTELSARGKPPKHTATGESPWRSVYGQLSIAWVNLGALMIDAGIPHTEVPPTSTADGQHMIRFTKDCRIDITEDEYERFHDGVRDPVSEPIRKVERLEPLYTLNEAKQILDSCQEHVWSVETNDSGAPVAVQCDNCGERRSIR